MAKVAGAVASFVLASAHACSWPKPNKSADSRRLTTTGS